MDKNDIIQTYFTKNVTGIEIIPPEESEWHIVIPEKDMSNQTFFNKWKNKLFRYESGVYLKYTKMHRLGTIEEFLNNRPHFQLSEKGDAIEIKYRVEILFNNGKCRTKYFDNFNSAQDYSKCIGLDITKNNIIKI